MNSSQIYLQFGKNEEVIIAKPPRHSGLPKKSPRGISEKTFGQEESRKIQQEVRDYKKLVAGYASACWHCTKGGVELRACSKCKAIGRNVLYCSKFVSIRNCSRRNRY